MLPLPLQHAQQGFIVHLKVIDLLLLPNTVALSSCAQQISVSWVVITDTDMRMHIQWWCAEAALLQHGMDIDKAQ